MAHKFDTFLGRLRQLLAGPAGEGVSDCQLLQRYVMRQEPTAFAALLERHGPMVLGVCQRYLKDSHDADDAFQATFLVLLRKASSITRRESVGSWLYGVAYRVALRAKTNADRWHARHRQVEDMPCTHDIGTPDPQDLRLILDEELERLPEKYRQAVVLCYLEGRTTEEAAQQLGCPFGTVSSRLARARDLLRTRLTRRGLSVASSAVAALITEQTTPAALPATLRAATLQLASLTALGEGAAGGVSASIASLADDAVQAMSLVRMKVGISLLLVVSLAGIGTGMALHQGNQQHSGERTQKTPPDNAPVASSATLKSEKPSPSPEDVKAARSLVPREIARWGQGYAVLSAAFSPDSQRLATAGQGKGPRLWNVATRQEGRSFAGHNQIVPAVAFAPDGKVLASGGYDAAIRLWDLDTGAELHRLKKHVGGVQTVAFSRDGAFLVSGGFDALVVVWNLATREPVHEFRYGGCAFYAVGFSPDGKTLAGGNVEQRLLLWDLDTGQTLHNLRLPGQVWSVAFSPDGQTLASGSDDGLIRLWDATAGQERQRFGEEKDPVFGVAFSSDGKKLAAATAKHTLRLWEVATGKEIPCPDESGAPASEGRTVAFSPDGHTLVVGCKDGTLRLWKLPQDSDQSSP